MTARHIRTWQTHLNRRHGAGLTVDGDFGPATLAASLGSCDCAKPEPDDDTTTGNTGEGEDPPRILLDERTERHIATLDPRARPTMRRLAELAKVAAAGYNADAVVISGHRSWEEQDRLYEQGRTRPGKIVTNAKGGQSNHNFGLAVDFGIFSGGEYLDSADPRTASRVHRAIAQAAEAAGLNTLWGGDWAKPDIPHHEFATGLNIAEKRERYKQNGTVFRV